MRADRAGDAESPPSPLRLPGQSPRVSRRGAAIVMLLSWWSAGAGPVANASASPAAADSSSAVAVLKEQASNLEPLVHTKLARKFLSATAELSRVESRTVSYDSSRTHYYWASEAAALPEEERAKLITRELDESFYYNVSPRPTHVATAEPA
jgi:hypothetical protein